MNKRIHVIAKTYDEQTKENRQGLASIETVKALQVAVYVMVGGGFTGVFAAQQPKSFYLDSRAGATVYPKKAVMQAVEALVQEAKVVGLDPNDLPELPAFPNCGVF